MGSPDNLLSHMPQAQEEIAPARSFSCSFAAPIDKLSGLPTTRLWYFQLNAHTSHLMPHT